MPVIRLGRICLLLFAATPALAWGPEGHHIIAYIAAPRLSPAARTGVAALLGSPVEEALAGASVWADEVRPERRETGPRHYVNIELDTAGYVAARDCPNQDCIVGQIERDTRILSTMSGPTPERIEALKFLAHFMSDLHQPLHCADHHDRGGNQVYVQIHGRETNLHRVWDTDVVEALGSDPVAIAKRLNAQISAAEANAWSKGTPADWCNQSFVIARDRIYAHTKPSADSSVRMTNSRMHADSEIAAVQLKRAGVPLANTLNRG